jgi:glycine dehydrogenase subunit 1
MALANTIHLALLGAEGMRDVGIQCLERAHYLADRLAQIPGVALAHGDAPFFREFVIRLPASADRFVNAALGSRILAGVPLSRFSPNRPNDLLVSVTEKRSKDEMDRYVEALSRWARAGRQAPEEAACPS